MLHNLCSWLFIAIRVRQFDRKSTILGQAKNKVSILLTGPWANQFLKYWGKMYKHLHYIWNWLDVKIRREVEVYWALLAYGAAGDCDFLLTFLDGLSVPSSRAKNPLKMGSLGCPETSTINCHYSMSGDSEERNSLLTRRLCYQMNSGDCYSVLWMTTGFMGLSILTGWAG
jgi:hypothetical protein